MPETSAFKSSARAVPGDSPATSSESEKRLCSLCGLPVGLSKVERTLNGSHYSFCCPGCMHVFEILFNNPESHGADFRDTELYRVCMASGIIPRDETDMLRMQSLQKNTPENAQVSSDFDDGLSKKLTLHVNGMWCTACSWLLETVLGKSRGILDVRISFLTDLAQITYLPHLIHPKDILSQIAELGYTARPADESPLPMTEERKNLLLRLGVSVILTANVMMISFALYFGFFQDLGDRAIGYLSYPLWILCSPVVFYSGFPILRRAWLGFRHLNASMDTLIAVGTLAAYFYSLMGLRNGSLHLYFDTAAMLITVVLLGRFIEIQAREAVSRGITELYSLARGKVRLQLGDVEKWVSSDGVETGAVFSVRSGERIPLDGIILSGTAEADESFLTGESRPARKKSGDTVMGGALLLDGELRLQATRVGEESAIGQMISLMQEALTGKNSFEILADRVTRFIVPFVLLLAAGTAAYGTWVQGMASHEALLRAVTVLVITCPCALGIATPLAKVAAVGAGRSRGILIRNPSALERVKDLDVLVCDKTGTLTEGVFSLHKIVTTRIPEHQALARVASIETGATHLLAREILHKARALSIVLEEASDVEYFEGLGAKGSVHGVSVAAGNRAFMKQEGLFTSPTMDQTAGELESNGDTVLFFGWDREVQGYMTFGDALRKGVPESLEEIRRRGLTVHLVSGDSHETTRAIARCLDVQHFQGQALPGDKVKIIRSLQQQGHRVGMLGDGINDAAALAQADVGIALGASSNILQEASDITLMRGHPQMILEVLDLSHMTTRIIHQNLFFAFFYNIIGIPLAVAGMLNPLVAVLAMFASSLTVTGNTLRISRNNHDKENRMNRMNRIISALFVAITLLSFSFNAMATQDKTKPSGNPVVVIKTSLGEIHVELFQEKAPATVQNFLRYVDEKFYDGTIFHRVIDNFMIQGGGFTPDMKNRSTHEPIKNEASVELKNDRGTIAMARTNVVDSATSQFFINVKDNTFLNHKDNTPSGFGYAVFGKVIEGMDVVDKIEKVETSTMGGYQNVPKNPVIIESITRLK